MLAGVGGKTVAEAKASMSYAEAKSWTSFIRQHGPLNLTSRIDEIAARLMWSVFKAAGAKSVTVDDFMPAKKSSEPERQASIEEVMSLLRTSSRMNKAARG